VCPPMPKELRKTSRYAGRILNRNHHHIDTGLPYHQEYILLGVWPDPSGGAGSQSAAHMHKALGLFFDLDFTDVCMSRKMKKEYTLKAKAWMREGRIERIYSHSSGREIEPNVEISDLLKAYLSSLPKEEMDELIDTFVPPVLTTLEQFAGKPQKITFTGTGVHIHYWIHDDEGYTKSGAEVHGGNPIQNIAGYKRWYKAVNKHIASEHGFAFDAARCDVGTACTRELGNVNQKNSMNRKIVREVLAERTDVARRLRLRNVVTPKKESVAKGIKSAVKDAKGRAFDKRRSRTPKHINENETVTFLIAGTQTQYKVNDLLDNWELLAEQGVLSDDEKLRCRLDWVSDGSINCFCRKTEEGLMFICAVEKYLNAEDRHVHEKDGQLIGMWVFCSSLESQLDRDGNGRILYHGTNIQRILLGDPRVAGKIRENVRLRRVEMHSDIDVAANPGNKRKLRQSSKRRWIALSDRHADWIGSFVLGGYFSKIPPKDHVYTAIDLVAATAGYDPVADWIEGVEWDGVRRLDGDNAWLPKILGMDKRHPKFNMYATFGRASMLGTMRYIYADDTQECVSQHVLMLMGPQRTGKSTFASTFAGVQHLGTGDYFADQNVNLDDKTADIMAVLAGKFVMEFPENVSFSRAGSEKQKNFITQRQMIGRPAYGRNTVTMNRETYFICTTNHSVPFSDPTGSRRYMAVDLFNDLYTRHGYIDNIVLNDMIPQLYAEAYQRVVLGEHIPEERQMYVRLYCGDLVEDWNLTNTESVSNEEVNITKTTQDDLKDALCEITDMVKSLGDRWIHGQELTRRLREEYGLMRIQAQRRHNYMMSLGWRPHRDGNLRGWIHGGEPLSSKQQQTLAENVELKQKLEALEREREELIQEKTSLIRSNANLSREVRARNKTKSITLAMVEKATDLSQFTDDLDIDEPVRRRISIYGKAKESGNDTRINAAREGLRLSLMESV
jgi:hypothetical protein